jgi:hypothetical protein
VRAACTAECSRGRPLRNAPTPAAHAPGRPPATGRGPRPLADGSADEHAGSTSRPSHEPWHDGGPGGPGGLLASRPPRGVTGARPAVEAPAVGHLPRRQRLAAGAWPAPWATPCVDPGLTVDGARVRGAAPPRWRPCGVCLNSLGPESHASVPRHGDRRPPSAGAGRPQRGRGDAHAGAGRARGTRSCAERGGRSCDSAGVAWPWVASRRPGRGGPGPPGRAPIGAPAGPGGRPGQWSSDGVSAQDWTACGRLAPGWREAGPPGDEAAAPAAVPGLPADGGPQATDRGPAGPRARPAWHHAQTRPNGHGSG